MTAPRIAVWLGLLAVLGTMIAAVAAPSLRPRLLRVAGVLAGGLIAAYAVARGVAEFWVVDYADPASYARDWGGPSLIGVFAVHTGPGVLVVAGGLVYLLRRRVRRPGRPTEATAAQKR